MNDKTDNGNNAIVFARVMEVYLFGLYSITNKQWESNNIRDLTRGRRQTLTYNMDGLNGFSPDCTAHHANSDEVHI